MDRIIDQFPADRQAQIRVMLSESLKGVISQMLCKKIGGGRVPALEVLIVTPSVSNLIREAKIFQIPSIMQTSKKHGMVLMNESFADLVKRKVVEPQEAYAKAVDKAGLLASSGRTTSTRRGRPREAALRPEATDARGRHRRRSPRSRMPRAGARAAGLLRAASCSSIRPTPSTRWAGGRSTRGRPAAVRAAKGRDDGQPLPLVAADLGQARSARRTPGPRPRDRLAAALLAGAADPGAAGDGRRCPTAVTSGTGTVAVRVPARRWRARLCAAARARSISTSANRSGAAAAARRARKPWPRWATRGRAGPGRRPGRARALDDRGPHRRRPAAPGARGRRSQWARTCSARRCG